MSLEEIRNYWRILKKRLWLIALLILTTMGTIFYRQHTAEPTYQATLRFQITSPPRSEVILYGGFGTPRVRDEIPYIRENFLNVLTSGAVARQVIEELGLKNTNTRDITANIETEEIRGSDFIRVKVFARKSQLAADIANAVINEALRQYGQLRARSATLSKQFISAELDTTRQELQKMEQAWINFKVENRIGSLGEMISEQQDLLRSLRLRRDELLATGSLDKARNYDQLITQREAELQDLVSLSAQYDTLQADVQQYRETYDFLLDKETQAKLTENEALTVGFIQVLGEARPPSSPMAPYDFKVMALGGMASLALGVIIAFVLEFATLDTASQEKQEAQAIQSRSEA